MRITVEQASFSPAELEAITGLSVDSQRDWRKRGFLRAKDDRKWNRFDLSDVVFVMVMKAFADMGISLNDAKDAASIAILPVLRFAELRSASSGPISKPTSVRPTSDDRFVVITRKGERNSVSRVASLTDLQGWLDKQKSPRAIICCFFDCLAAAEHLEQAHGGPLITHRRED